MFRGLLWPKNHKNLILVQCPSHAVVAKRVRGLWMGCFFYYFWVFRRGRWPHPFFDPPQLRPSVLSPYDRLLFDINYNFQAIFDPLFFLGQRPSCYSPPSSSRLLGQHRRHIAYTLVFPYRTLSTTGVFFIYFVSFIGTRDDVFIFSDTLPPYWIFTLFFCRVIERVISMIPRCPAIQF